MSEQTDLPSLLSSLSANADDLVAQHSGFRAQNAGLRAENAILRTQRNDLRARITELETSLSKHQAREAELMQFVHRMSDTFSSVHIGAGSTIATEKNVRHGPLTPQKTVLRNRGSRLGGGNSPSFGKPNPFGATSPSEPANGLGFSLTDPPFEKKKEAGSSPPLFGVAPKFGDSKVVDDPFKTTAAQNASTSAREPDRLKNEPTSIEPGRKQPLFSSCFDKPSTKSSTETAPNATVRVSVPGTTDSSFRGAISNNSFAADALPVAETDDTKKRSRSSENSRENVSTVLRETFPAANAGDVFALRREGTADTSNAGSTRKNEVSTTAEQKLQEKEVRDCSILFPAPTPLSWMTFRPEAVSKTQNESAEEKNPLFPPPPLHPPYSKTNPYRESSVGGETYMTISQMLAFNAYSVEEIRLWDYVNGEKGWQRNSPLPTSSA